MIKIHFVIYSAMAHYLQRAHTTVMLASGLLTEDWLAH